MVRRGLSFTSRGSQTRERRWCATCTARAKNTADVHVDEVKTRTLITRSAMLRSSLLFNVATAATALSGANKALAVAIADATDSAIAPNQVTLIPSDSVAPKPFSKVVLNTLSDCQLAVSRYPTFAYNALGGGGLGRVVEDNGDVLVVCWDAESLQIPSIKSNTSSVLGIPIPPPLDISIVPRTLRGTINKVTGQTDLEFLATFEFTAGPLYKASPLIVQTNLTSEISSGELLSGKGQRLTADGHLKLVGVARVPKTGDDPFLDTFLMLPTDALAVLSAEIKFLP